MHSCRRAHALLPHSSSRRRLFSNEGENEDSTSHLASLLRSCGDTHNLQQGKLLHSLINRSGHSHNVFLSNLVIQMYGKCRAVDVALDVFDNLLDRNLFSWGVVIEACNQNQEFRTSVQLFQQMRAEGVIPDNITFLGSVTAQSVSGNFREGKRLHAYASAAGLVTDVVLGTGLISMYAHLGSPNDSHFVFDSMHDRSVVTWNAMISVFAPLSSTKALQLFQQMQLECILPNRTSFIAALNSFGEQGNIVQAKWVHAHVVGSGLDSDVVTGSALINSYGKCRSLETACIIFKSLHNPNLICWTAMMVAYSNCGHIKEALHLLHQMDVEGMAVDAVTYISLVDGCATTSSIMDGKYIHTRIVSVALESIRVENGLVIMYGKCGIVDSSLKIFMRMKKKNVASWNSIITALALNGDGKMALEFYRQMQDANMLPNTITFSSVLSACNRAGLPEEGLSFFQKMGTDYGILPLAEHYICLIDLMGRVGRENEAEDLMKKLRVEPTAMGWITSPHFSTSHLDMEPVHLVASV